MKMGNLQRLFLGFLVIILFDPRVSACDVFENSYGYVTDDQEIPVGSPLVFRCTLNNKTLEGYDVTSEQIIVKFRSKILEDLVIVDDSTVEYRVQNATENDGGLYDCYVPITGLESPQLVCSSVIAVGYEPLPVQNFSCISEGYRNLTCRWYEPPNGIPTRYSLSDYLYDNESLRRHCPVPVGSGCQFRVDTKPAYIQSMPVLNFIVSGRNSLGPSKQYFRINHFEIIKPAVPSRVVFKEVSKTSLVLQIFAPKGLENGEFPNGLIYEVKYYSISTKLNSIKVEIVKGQGNLDLRLEDLVPHTQYKFEVRCRLNIPGDKYYWSDTRNATEITLPDVPYLAPTLLGSCFDVTPIGSTLTVSLFWQGVPDAFKNGEGFCYYIYYHEHHQPTRMSRQAPRKQRSSFVIVQNGTTYTFENLDPGTAHMFTIVAVNSVGISRNLTATLVVDKADKLLQGPKDITVISYGQGKYDISWKPPDPRFANFTLFWCRTLKARPAKCEGALDWMPIADKTYHKLVLPDHLTNFQFAVATNHDHQTSGMFWASCTVLYGVPYKVREIELIPHTSTSLRVQWSLKCEAEKKVIKEYALHYCAYQGSCIYDNWKNCKVNGLGVNNWPFVSITNTSKTEHILSRLNPFTCYFAVMRVRTDGGWGENSDYAFEKSMSAAPSDPPSHVVAIPLMLEGKAASITVTFDPPSMPNGIISRYIIYYNKTSSDDAYYHKEIRAQDVRGGVTLQNVFYYTNYSIEVAACVDRACSMLSDPVYVSTGITRPGIINVPRLELGEEYVNVSWEAPLLPNGPIEYYELKMQINDTVKIERYFNISGEQTHFMFKRDCTSLGTNETIFNVRAVNFKEDVPLYGDYSGSAKMVLCPTSTSQTLAGIIVGSFAAILLVCLGIYMSFRWLTKQAKAKNTKIFLHPELESPLDNPLSSYDKFKSGLQNDHDAGIASDRSYDRLYTNLSERNLLEAEENSTRSTSNRNYSGESNSSNKCHDSISSANTTKTHNSMDSGAEIESPPSPDSFCSDSSSMNTTPRTFKPGLDMVTEMNLASKDSGLEKDGRPNHSCTNIGLQAKGRCFEGKIGEGQLNAYHKYAVRGSSNVVSFADNNHNLSRMERLSLSNSEPSVADFDVGDGTEPLVNPVMHPYSKYGLARSDSNGLNNQNNLMHSPGYSKFGLTYRPLRPIPVIQPHMLASYAVTEPFFPQKPPVPYAFPDRKKDPFSASSPDAQQPRGAYSKFGVQPSVRPNGYVLRRDAANNPSHELNNTPSANSPSLSTDTEHELPHSDCQRKSPPPTTPDLSTNPPSAISGADLLGSNPDDVLGDIHITADLDEVLKDFKNAERSIAEADPPVNEEDIATGVQSDGTKLFLSGGCIIQRMPDEIEVPPIVYEASDTEQTRDSVATIYKECNGLPLSSTFPGESRLENTSETGATKGYVGLPRFSDTNISAHVAPQQSFARLSVESV